MKNKLTVAEYAQKHKISVQAVYKKIDKLEVIEEEKNGKTIKFILEEDKEDIKLSSTNSTTNSTEDIKPSSTTTNKEETADLGENTTVGDIKPFSTNSTTNSTEDIKPSSTAENPYIDYIKHLKSQIQEKDKQIERLQNTIEEKDKQAKEQFEKLTDLLYRSQQLEAITHRLLGDGETTDKEDDITIITPDKTDNNTQSQEQTKKKGFFKRLFGKKQLIKL